MGKGKMGLLDTVAMVKELREKLIGLRVANIYHFSARCYQIKLSSSQSKQRLIIESGVRIHTTAYVRDHENLPNGFAVKLRKHLRMLRLESINQLGVDRVIDMTFGTGSRAYHLILELYAQGNIILTDSNYQIIMLLRTHSHSYDPSSNPLSIAEQAIEADDEIVDDENADEIERKGAEKDRAAASNDQSVNQPIAQTAASPDRIAVREIYPYHHAQQPYDSITREMVNAVMRAEVTRQRDEEEKARAMEAVDQLKGTEPEQVENEADSIGNQAVTKKTGKKNKGGQPKPQAPKKQRIRPKLPPMKSVLANGLRLGGELTEHCLVKAGIDVNKPFDGEVFDESLIDKVVAAFADAPMIVKRLSTEPMKAYVVAKQESGKAPEAKKPKTKKKGGNAPLSNTDENQSNQSAQAPQSVSQAVNQSSSSAEPVVNTEPKEIVIDDQPLSNPAPSQPSAQSTNPSSDSTQHTAGSVQVYTEYLPILLSQHQAYPEYLPPIAQLIEFPSLDAAMDEYYSKLEEQREELRLLKEKAAALHKIERVKQSHETQLAALSAQLAENDYKAQLIEMNTAAVDAAIQSINVEVARGTDWKELARIIKEEKQRGNPIASMIQTLKLDNNQATITLTEGLIHLQPGYNAATCPPEQRPVRVDIDLGQSAFNNAQYYYQTRKRQAVKADKTIDASAKALKAAQFKTNQALNAVDVRARIQKQRKIMWFEKFHWFISSENYLVIGGKDAQQNEAIVKRHMDRYDVYIHAEVHGASSVIVKNPYNQSTGPPPPIPPFTLAQAGLMCVCRSSAWKSKTPIDSYWVHPHQVSKTAPTGMYLATGSFMIRGKKNFIPRMPMVMGLGLLFKVDESCVARHAGERAVRGSEDVDELKDNQTSAQSASQPFQSSQHAAIDDDFDVTSNLVRARPAKPTNPVPSSATIKPETKPVEDVVDEPDSDIVEGEAGPQPVNLFAEAEAKREKTEPTKKRMSAAEKRKAKKGPSQPEPESQPIRGNTADSDDESKESSSKSNAKNSKSKGKAKTEKVTDKPSAVAALAPAPVPRGKRGKAKKLAKKYGQQDEEDLALAASLLGLQNVAKKKKEIVEREKTMRGAANMSDESSESDSEDESSEPAQPVAPAAQPAEDDSTKTCFHCKQRGHVFKNCPENPINKQSNQSTDQSITLSAARRAFEAENEAELAAIKEEEGEMGGVTDMSQLSIIDSLTAKPFDDDLIEFCIPVCAPYVTLNDYKYRVKLVNGTQKKGKLSDAAVHLFVKQAGNLVRQIECMHAIRDEEISQVLLSNIKLAAAGLDTGGKRRKGDKA